MICLVVAADCWFALLLLLASSVRMIRASCCFRQPLLLFFITRSVPLLCSGVGGTGGESGERPGTAPVRAELFPEPALLLPSPPPIPVSIPALVCLSA
jgi:hypothetical protein